MQERIVSWLRSVSGLEAMTEEFVEDLPGSAGLFFKGEQTVSAAADILGREIRRVRLRWKLVTNTAQAPLVSLQQAPVLGLLQTVRLEDGHLSDLDEEQIPRWESELIIEFTAVPETGEE